MKYIEFFAMVLLFFQLSNFKIFAMIILQDKIEIDEENPAREICTICFDSAHAPDNIQLIQFCHKEHKVCSDCAKKYLQYLYKNKRELICHVCRKELNDKWLKELNIIKRHSSKKRKYLIQVLCLSGTYALLISLLMLRYLIEGDSLTQKF